MRQTAGRTLETELAAREVLLEEVAVAKNQAWKDGKRVLKPENELSLRAESRQCDEYRDERGMGIDVWAPEWWWVVDENRADSRSEASHCLLGMHRP